MYLQVGISALVGDHSTVPLTRISCNTIFSKSQNARKVGTLCIFSYFCNRQSKNSFFGQKLKISRFFKQSKDSYFSLNKKINLTNVWNFFTKDISSALFLLHSIVVFTFCRKTAPSRLSLRLSTMLVFSNFDSAFLKPIFNKKFFECFCHYFPYS